MADFSDLVQPFNIFGGGSYSAPTQTATVTPAAAPAQPTARAPLPGEQVYDLSGGKATPIPNTSNVPPAPKTPTAAPNPVPTYSFLDGSKYSASGKQIKAPTVVTAKPAITDLNNKQAGLDQAVQAQNQQTQNMQVQQAQTQQNQQQQQQTPPATPPATPATTDTTGLTDIQKQANDNATQANTAIAAVQKQADAAYSQFQSNINSIINGSFPLTSAQQAQITATQNSFNQLVQAQQMANANYEGQVALSGAIGGVAQSSPLVQASLVNSAMTADIQKIADIDSQASNAVAQLQQGFMQQDYTMINGAYTAASKAFADKTAAIQTMASNVKDATNQALQIFNAQQAAAKQASDLAQQQLQNQQAAIQFAAANGINQPFYLVGNTAINTQTGQPATLAQYQQATGQQVGLPEDQTDFSKIQHIEDPAVANLRQKYGDAGILPTDSIDQATAKLQNSALYRKDTYIAPSPYGGGGILGGVGTGVDAQGNPIAIPDAVAPYYNQTTGGVGYVDATTLQGTAAQKKQIVDAAQSVGLKVITNKNEAADLTNIQDAQSKLNTIGTIMAGIDQPDALSRDLYGLGLTKLSTLAQTNAQQAAAGALQSVGLDILKAISGIQGFRGNSSVVQQVTSHLPSIYDTNDVAQQKIDYINQLISDRENAIVGTPQTSASAQNPQEGQTGVVNGITYTFTNGQWVSQ